MDETVFKEIVWDYYNTHQRDLPWRKSESDGSFTPYKILVSEIMLQQTQTNRVIPKYESFLTLFPTVESLACATLAQVLEAWSGLGYNRRAKFLWQAAQKIIHDYKGEFPATIKDLTALPGVGVNTAGAVVAYAYNRPVAFIETNIRTVYIHHFFPNEDAVSDNAILELVHQSIDTEHPREWYWALMDYGVYIKSTVGNVSRSSSQYVKQSSFEGSKRQIRGRILKILIYNPIDRNRLQLIIADDRYDEVLSDLLKESLIKESDGIISL